MDTLDVYSEPAPNTSERALFLESIQKLYEKAGPDYAYWSKAFHMHFGYYRWGMNPFALEPMLEEMNRQVGHLLALPNSGNPHIVDLGCGLGAVARQLLEWKPNLRISGITLVPWQVEQARHKNKEANLHDQIDIMLGDYTQLPMPNCSVDGAYAIESSCYASGSDKADLIRESARVLKPGASWVIADGFMKQSPPSKGIVAYLNRKVCDYWALPGFAEIDRFCQVLKEEGFELEAVRDISWHVAPSAAYIPRTCIRFLWDHFYGKKSHHKTSKEAFQNAWASVMGGILGTFRSYFAYYLIKARKK